MRHPIIVGGRGVEDVEVEVEGYLTIQTYMWELRGESLGVPTLLWIGIKKLNRLFVMCSISGIGVAVSIIVCILFLAQICL